MYGHVYYQPFELNVDAHFGNDKALVLNEENAQFMVSLNFNDIKTKEEFVEAAFREMNIGDILQTDYVRERARKVGHTSMSIGDYVEFSDGSIYLCKSEGWKFFPAKNI